MQWCIEIWYFPNFSIKHLKVIKAHALTLISIHYKTNGIIRKLQNVLPRLALLTIYKWFIRRHLDYGDIIYDKAFNESFHAKLESLQYNATLAITGAIKGSKIKTLVQKNEFFCIKFSKVNHRHTYLILYQIVIKGNIKQEIQATLPLSLLNMIILRILFSLLQ